MNTKFFYKIIRSNIFVSAYNWFSNMCRKIFQTFYWILYQNYTAQQNEWQHKLELDWYNNLKAFVIWLTSLPNKKQTGLQQSLNTLLPHSSAITKLLIWHNVFQFTMKQKWNPYDILLQRHTIKIHAWRMMNSINHNIFVWLQHSTKYCIIFFGNVTVSFITCRSHQSKNTVYLD